MVLPCLRCYLHGSGGALGARYGAATSRGVGGMCLYEICVNSICVVLGFIQTQKHVGSSRTSSALTREGTFPAPP